jgi:hypothetical protein
LSLPPSWIFNHVHLLKRVFSFFKETFEFSGKLGKHIREVHHFEAKAECIFCKQMFVDSLALLTHNREHHRDKKWCCRVCGKGFERWSMLRFHLLKYHLEKTRQQTIDEIHFQYIQETL